MRNAIFAVFAITLSFLACSRSSSSSPKSTGDISRTLIHDGLERSYLLHTPPNLNLNGAVPLVIVFHGGGGNAENAMRMTDFNKLSDEKGFVVVYPNGTGKLADKLFTWNGGTCCGYAQENNIDDVGFVRAIVGDVETILSIDTKRIYATGMSNGGIMSYRLACEASDLFAAIGPVSGTLNFSPCEPEGPVSVVHFHGTADQHLPYNGGIGEKSLAGVGFASASDSIQFWAGYDHCAAEPQTQSFSDIRLEIYTNCAKGTSVEFYTIIDGLHAWPGSSGPAGIGGDKPTQTISATGIIWNFFAAHPKP